MAARTRTGSVSQRSAAARPVTASILIGVDIGGTKIEVVATDTAFSIRGEARAVSPSTAGPEALVEAVVALIEAARGQAGGATIAAIGVGIPGSVDGSGNVSPSPNMEGWNGPFPLSTRLQSRLSVPIAVTNDVRAGLLGEYHHGCASGHGDVLGVWLGTGVGGGLILDGRLRAGTHGACGEIGHVTVKPDGRRCGCGRRGCLEAYAGRAAMERRARKLVDRGEKTRLFSIMNKTGRTQLTSGVFAKALAEGDAMAKTLLHDAIAAAGVGIASVVNAVDVGLVVIGGGMGTRLGAPLVDQIRVAMQPHLHLAGTDAVLMSGGSLGDRAGALGAATLAAESVSGV